MLVYLFAFMTTGFFLGLFLPKKPAALVCILIAPVWTAAHGPWGTVAFMELITGCLLGRIAFREWKGKTSPGQSSFAGDALAG